MSLIKARNLSYVYEEVEPPVAAVKNVSLDIEAGEFIAIQGPSGSGKSTLLHILGGMLQCQTGELYIDNIDISRLSKWKLALVRNRRLGFIFQYPFLLPRANVLDNILLPTKYPLESATQDERDVAKAIAYAKRLKIDHRLHHYPNKLSGGEQQLVAIIRALIRGAKIILADEPTGNLDSRRSDEVFDQLIKLKQEENLTVVVVTHDSKIASKAEKVMHIHDGALTGVTSNVRVAYKPAKKTHAKPPLSAIKTASSFCDLFLCPLRIGCKVIPQAFKNILRNKARSILTMLGIIIGIAAILAVVTLGQFTKNKILLSYTTLGANTLAISGYPSWQMRATDTVPLVFKSFSMDNDIKPLPQIFPNLEMLSPILSLWNMQLSYAGKNLTNATMLGVGKDYIKITEREIINGRDLKSYDVKAASSVCIISDGIAARLFANQNPIGKIIHLKIDKNYFTCSIIGVLAKSSSARSVANLDMRILVPYTFFRRINNNIWRNRINIFVAKVDDPENVQPVGNAIKKYFSAKYGASGEFGIDPNILLLAQMRRFLNLFTLMLAVVSLIALVVGGIGITNMMLVAISERFKEIGLRKAVGATDLGMQMQFLIEAIIICCLAGIIGLIIGFAIYEAIIYGATKIVSGMKFELIISPLAVILAVISMLVVGILSGIYPARKAKSLEIITALRSE